MLAKKVMEQKFDCKYCGKKFHKETTLTTHMCVKKRRYLDINTEGFRFGFRTFQLFYTITTNIKKIKTQAEFIDSPYYIDFVKFGNHVAMLKPVHIDQYIEFVIKSGLKIEKWTSDPVFELYIENLVKTEPSTSAVDRTIEKMSQWCEENNIAFNQFFTNISANEAAYLIKTGRISPWVLYLCRSAEDLQSRFTADHDPMIKHVIDPGFWMRKFKKADDDVEYIKNLLEQAGL
ncbi:MAG TPA: hypothetical protein VIY47_07315 [Ignavibacteriaceae bacterium]